ncbi:MAG: GTP cyclohydrolase I FolE2 [Fibrobacteres bacterium]|nr:GTP cyclohydrolase I FolE2 [Fibrobacterota bacterium]
MKKTILVSINRKPFPILLKGEHSPKEKKTAATVSITARIPFEHEMDWHTIMLRLLHNHRDCVGIKTLHDNIADYMKSLNADFVRVDFEYQHFIEKRAPISGELGWVVYPCTISARTPSVPSKTVASLKVDAPILCQSILGVGDGPKEGILTVTIESESDIQPDYLIDTIDKMIPAPVYSFLKDEDKDFLIETFKFCNDSMSETIRKLAEELHKNKKIQWFTLSINEQSPERPYYVSVSANQGMITEEEYLEDF